MIALRDWLLPANRIREDSRMNLSVSTFSGEDHHYSSLGRAKKGAPLMPNEAVEKPQNGTVQVKKYEDSGFPAPR